MKLLPNALSSSCYFGTHKLNAVCLIMQFSHFSILWMCYFLLWSLAASCSRRRRSQVCVLQLVLWIRPMTDTSYKPAISQHQGGTASLTTRRLNGAAVKTMQESQRKILFFFSSLRTVFLLSLKLMLYAVVIWVILCSKWIWTLGWCRVHLQVYTCLSWIFTFQTCLGCFCFFS